MTPTILTSGLVKSEAEKFQKENAVSTVQRAFLEYVLEKRLDLDREEVLEAIIDGSHDRGIDAIHIDEESENRPVVYLFQSKYYENEEKFDRALEGNALSKMQHAIESLILKKERQIHEGNIYLLSKLKDIRALSNPRFQIIFCSNSFSPMESAKKEFDEFIKSHSQGHDFFRAEYISLKELGILITPATTRQINTKLKLTGRYFDWSLGEARVVVGRISGRELAELRKREGMELFDRNVRGYLTRQNTVNKDIFATATDREAAGRFFFLNNGVTIVCSNLHYLPIEESPELEISNLQVVNGGQTTNSIFEALEAGQLAASVYVLVRIVATENTGFIEKITESTNKQTNVRSRDLRSNDITQKTIARLLLNKGFYYETRKNKYKDSPAARTKRIDMEVAAQACYAFTHKKPADAKNKKRELFGSLYEDVFQGDDMQLAENILVSFKCLEWVRKQHARYKGKYSFVKYAELHSIALLAENGANTVSTLSDKLIPTYEKILRATDVIVKEENDKLKEEYSHRMLFIDPATFGRIKEALEDIPKKMIAKKR